MNAYLYTMKQHARDGAAQLVAYVPLLVLGTFLLVAMNTFMLMGSSSLTQGGGGVAQHSAVLSSYGNGAAVLGALSDGELEQVRYRRLGTVGGRVQAVCDNRNETYCKCSIVCGYILQVGRWAATEATLFEHIWSITPQNQRVLVDVGGNVGFFTTLSSAWGARIVVFEPQTAPRRLLQLSLLDARQDITKNYEPSAAAAELARLLPLPWQSAALHTRTRSVTVQTNRRGHVKMQSGPAQLEVQLQDATTQPHSMHEKTKADLQDAPAAAAGPQQKNTNTQHNHQREQQALQQTALTGSSLAAAAAANVAAHGGGARLISLQHDRAKAQPLDGAVPDPFLQRIGLQTADGRIKADMQVRNCHCHCH